MTLNASGAKTHRLARRQMKDVSERRGGLNREIRIRPRSGKGRPDGAGFRASSATAESQMVTSQRRTRARSYAGAFC